MRIRIQNPVCDAPAWPARTLPRPDYRLLLPTCGRSLSPGTLSLWRPCLRGRSLPPVTLSLWRPCLTSPGSPSSRLQTSSTHSWTILTSRYAVSVTSLPDQPGGDPLSRLQTSSAHLWTIPTSRYAVFFVVLWIGIILTSIRIHVSTLSILLPIWIRNLMASPTRSRNYELWPMLQLRLRLLSIYQDFHEIFIGKYHGCWKRFCKLFQFWS